MEITFIMCTMFAWIKKAIYMPASGIPDGFLPISWRGSRPIRNLQIPKVKTGD